MKNNTRIIKNNREGLSLVKLINKLSDDATAEMIVGGLKPKDGVIIQFALSVIATR